MRLRLRTAISGPDAAQLRASCFTFHALHLCALVLSSTALSASPSNTVDWWSLKPLERPPVPAGVNGEKAAVNPIDAFILAKLKEKNLRPSPEAGRSTLIRRAYFDLIGLPPRPEEVEEFTHDTKPLAYERLVDRLLASPHYGERWARHWLDVVHYGETHGYDKDKPRPNAWPYRDYVIRALNEDKPYSRFVQEQIAGDVLFPSTRDGIKALGFIAAGPWDLIGHEEVPESKIDGKIARHLDRDDMVMNTIQTFNSFTVQCAQCHNHKFDPIPSEDYYSLQAVFAALDRTDKKYDVDPPVATRRATLEEELRRIAARQKELADTIRARAGEPLAVLERRIAAAEKATPKNDAFGYHSGIEKSPAVAKWVQVDLGRPVPLARIALHPCRDDFNNIGEGFGFPPRFKVELSEDAAFKPGVTVAADHTQEDLENPKLVAQSCDAAGRIARFVRVTATKLAPRQDDYIFALAELEVFDTNGQNVALGAAVGALDSIEAPPRWQKGNLTDGWYPGATATQSVELVGLRAERTNLLAKATQASEQEQLSDLSQQMAEAKAGLDQLPRQSVVYAGAVRYGTGNFAGTSGKPRPIFVLNRGNVQKPGKEVGPGALSAVAALPARFDLPPGALEGERRAALARWLTDPRHPLTWRSIVNRVWQYHFGRGLVDTPNDFGRMGALPTHAELLDWLAVEFRDGGQSLKKLHRLIVTSATYRQMSGGSEAVISESVISKSVISNRYSVISGRGLESNKQKPAEGRAHAKLITDYRLLNTELDADNRYLWRMNRRKLEAEAIRDSVLFVSGQLDMAMGGPSFQDFLIEKPEHSPHYEYQLHDPEDAKCHRRSIYRFVVRSQPQPLMAALDCADPSIQTAKRNESISPLQALAMLNDALMVVMSKHFAERIGQGEGGLRERVARAYYAAIGHPPPDNDLKELIGYAKEFGLENLCRVLFNLNEFAFVD